MFQIQKICHCSPDAAPIRAARPPVRLTIRKKSSGGRLRTNPSGRSVQNRAPAVPARKTDQRRCPPLRIEENVSIQLVSMPGRGGARTRTPGRCRLVVVISYPAGRPAVFFFGFRNHRFRGQTGAKRTRRSGWQSRDLVRSIMPADHIHDSPVSALKPWLPLSSLTFSTTIVPS